MGRCVLHWMHGVESDLENDVDIPILSVLLYAQLVEQGNHTELLQRQGLYNELWSKQLLTQSDQDASGSSLYSATSRPGSSSDLAGTSATAVQQPQAGPSRLATATGPDDAVGGSSAAGGVLGAVGGGSNSDNATAGDVASAVAGTPEADVAQAAIAVAAAAATTQQQPQGAADGTGSKKGKKGKGKGGK